MMDWLCPAAGLAVKRKAKDEAGRIGHSALVLANGLLLLGEKLSSPDRRFQTKRLSPLSAGCKTQNLVLFVDHVDAHCAQAHAAGAATAAGPELHGHGSGNWAERSHDAVDPESQLWWLTQRIRSRTDRGRQRGWPTGVATMRPLHTIEDAP